MPDSEDAQGVEEQRKNDQRKLIEQSYRIADALESQGIKAYGPSKIVSHPIANWHWPPS